MIDESKRKKIIYSVGIFIAIVIVSSIVWLVFFNKKESLPPEEPVISESTSTDNTKPSTPVSPEIGQEDTTMYKNGVTFTDFNELKRFTVSEGQIDLIQYYLAEHANAQSTGVITAYTLDKASIRESKEAERFIFTFTVRDNAKNPYKVELSYTTSTDPFVRIFDKNNSAIEASSYDTD